MVNFGERIAYWYLRLQGFLLVEDFVLHRGEEIDRTADCDLVGVRFRHSVERIDGIALKPHPPFISSLSASEKHVAVIVQVKTGRKNEPGRAFEPERLKYALQFVGAFPEEDLDAIVKQLHTKPVVYAVNDWVVAKVLFAEEPDQTCAVPVLLGDAITFIEDRLAEFHNRKSADRLFFPDELMQFLAWRSSKRR